jgi:diguanylate cyclase (GGDEF)-like protein
MSSSFPPRKSTKHRLFGEVDPRQLQRIRRFGMACLLPFGYGLSLAIFWALQLIPGWVAQITLGLLLLGTLGFAAVFLSGRNRVAKDKNLTAPMSTGLILIMLLCCWFDPVTQIVYGPFALLTLLSAAFRLRQNSLFVLAGLILAGDALVIFIQFLQERQGALDLAVTNASVLALTLPGFVILSSKIRRLYRSLYMVSVKMENIEEHARRDELTGSFNRRYMMAALQQQKHLADGSDQNLCLAVVDLDHFKKINDEVGHLAGDEVLRTFAKLAQQNIRREDVFGRYGGEEFLLLLPGVGLLEALNTVERIRALTETRLGILAKLERKVTVSIGLTQFIPGESVLDLFARADVAMYMAKSGGRNQVVVEEPVEAKD